MAKRTRFEANALKAFLKSGWLLTPNADQVLVGWGNWSEAVLPPQDPEQAFVYSPDFYLKDEKPWKSTANWDLVSRDLFATHFLTGIGHNVNCEPLKWSEPRSEDFANCWQAIQEGFRERGLQKAVPVVFATARRNLAELESRKRLLAKVFSLPRHLTLYGMWSEGFGILGATPEILFSRTSSSGTVSTMALAGTRAKIPEIGREDRSEAQILLHDRKERHEHQVVVDDLKARLASLGEVAAESTEVLELPTLFHLRTRLNVLPKGEVSFVDLVKLLHPTPALGVAPRALGFEEIRRWDRTGEARQRFGAPFGVSWQGHDHCVVAIRNIQWQGSDCLLGSGCGVVAESEFTREWNELELKRDSVKRMLGL